MIKLNKTTQRAQSIIRAYQRASASDLYEAYKSPSHAKWCAMFYCKNLLKKMRGNGGKIVSHNCMQFTYAFKRGKDLVYITKNYNYIINGAF